MFGESVGRWSKKENRNIVRTQARNVFLGLAVSHATSRKRYGTQHYRSSIDHIVRVHACHKVVVVRRGNQLIRRLITGVVPTRSGRSSGAAPAAEVELRRRGVRTRVPGRGTCGARCPAAAPAASSPRALRPELQPRHLHPACQRVQQSHQPPPINKP